MREVFWQQVLGELAAGSPVFLALVAANSEHSPGTQGAAFFLSARGEKAGTVGGGIMELEIERRARLVLAAFPQPYFAVETLHHDLAAVGLRSGMICAGHQTNVYRLCPPSDHAAVAGLLRALAAREGGLYWVVEAAGMRLSPQAIASALGFCQAVANPRRLAIFGGGHCGRALARQMVWLDWEVEIYDPREALGPPALGSATASALGSAEGSWRSISSYDDAAAAVAAPERTAVVVMTSDFPSDVRALEGALAFPFPFLGLLGSRAKIAAIRSRLLERGIPPSRLDTVVAPVGLPIGAHKPPEIAVSIAAQLLEWSRHFHAR